MKTVVYTASYGSEADPLFQPNVLTDGVDYLLFSDGWKSPQGMSGRALGDEGPRMAARRVKALSSIYVPGYECVIWIDAAFQLLCDVNKIVRDAIDTGCPIVGMRHPHRSRIKDEAESIIRAKQAPAEMVRGQLAAYQSAGFDTDDYPMQVLTTTGLLVRFFNRDNFDKMTEWEYYWLENMLKFTERDQMSIDFCAKTCGLEIGYLQGHYLSNPYARYISHRSWR